MNSFKISSPLFEWFKSWAQHGFQVQRNMLGYFKNWDDCLTFLMDHGLAPFLYFNNKENSEFWIWPKEIKDHAKQAYYDNVYRSTMIAKELKTLRPIVEKQKMSWVLMKGPHLSWLYPEPHLRDVGDVDILIDDGCQSRWHSTLTGLGYRQAKTHSGLYSNGLLDLDLHTHPFNIENLPARRHGLCLSRDQWENEKRVIVLDGCEWTVFSWELTLLLLAVHFEKHSFQRLKWVLDFYWILHRAKVLGVDWGHVFDLARATQTSAPLYFSLTLTQYLCGAHVEEGLMAKLNEETSFISQHVFKWGIRFGPWRGLGPLLFSLRLHKPLHFAAFISQSFRRKGFK